MSTPQSPSGQPDDSSLTATRWASEQALGKRNQSTVLALADQAIISSVSFLMVLIVERAAGSEQLGIYALSFSCLMIAITTQRALLISPYTIFSRTCDEQQRTDMRGSIRAQVMSIACFFSLIGFVVLLVAKAFVVGEYSVVISLTLLALSAELLKDYFRTIAIADGLFHEAICIDGATSVLQLAIVAFFWFTDRFSASTAIAALLLSRIVIACVLGVLTSTRHRWNLEAVLGNVRQSWTLGRWLVFSQVISSFQWYALNWVIALTLGIRESGIFAACWTVVQLISPLIQGLGSAFEPQISGAFAAGGIPKVNAFVKKNTLLLAAVMAAYLSVLAFFGGYILRMLYGDEFQAHASLTALLAVGFAVLSIGIPASKGLTVLKYPNLVLVSVSIGLFVAIVLTTLLVQRYGLIGAAIGAIPGAMISSLMRWQLFWKVSNKTASEESDRGGLSALQGANP